MKRNLKIISISALLLTVPLFNSAQTPPMPFDDPKEGEEVSSAGAPVGNGTFILLTLAAAYAIRKRFEFSPEKEEGLE